MRPPKMDFRFLIYTPKKHKFKNKDKKKKHGLKGKNYQPEFYHQEQDQRSDENHFLNIYFKGLDFFNELLSIIKCM